MASSEGLVLFNHNVDRAVSLCSVKRVATDDSRAGKVIAMRFNMQMFINESLKSHNVY